MATSDELTYHIKYSAQHDQITLDVGIFEYWRKSVAQLEAVKQEHIELLQAIKIRDSRLDPVWMQQYAEERLKALGGER